jgi:hypothetical protein
MQPLWREKRAEKRRNGWPSARFFLVLVVSGLIFDYENEDEDEEENDRG